MSLAEDSRLYQIALEHLRAHVELGTDDDDDELALLEASEALQVAWLDALARP